MAFQTPITICEALEGIDQFRYALPALQREFVWKPQQICRLFDSIMRGYPIGSFLFWRLTPETARQFKFYQFMRDYNQLTNRHCPEYPMQTRLPEVAVLDGQQRLTAFNIALYGSYAWKLKYRRYKDPKAYPVRKLYLNLLAPAPENDDSIEFDFQFLTEDDAKARDEVTYWFPVAKIRDFDNGFKAMGYLAQHGMTDEQAIEWVGKLYEALKVERVVNYFQETEQNLDKVLNIFIRINSGGTTLSYSDLLLSIATTQWTEIDARSAVYQIVDRINSYGVEDGFAFSKDFVLKAGLMLADLPSVKFRAINFTAENMALIEQNWSRICVALETSAQLLERFGLSRRHISSQNAVLPIAYHLFKRGHGPGFLERSAHRAEREDLRRWLLQTTLAGVWGGGNVDALLERLRIPLREHETFPIQALFETMRAQGRDPYIDDVALDELTEVTYNDRRAFMLLSLLYDFVNLTTTHFHVDHVIPRTLCRHKKLMKAGYGEEDAKRIEDRNNRLPNLWLLQGTQNLEKGGQLPAEWLAERYPDEEMRRVLLERYDLQGLPDDMDGFEAFYEARRERLRARLLEMFGAPPRPQKDTKSTASEADENAWSETLELIGDERWLPLLRGLAKQELREPDNVELDLQREGKNVGCLSIVSWNMGDHHVYLAENPEPDLDGVVIAVSPEHEPDDVAAQLGESL